MVSATWALIAISLGFMMPVLVAATASIAAMDIRLAVGRKCFDWVTTVTGPGALVWRQFGPPELKGFDMDDEREIAEAVLSSGTLSDDETLSFRDPDDRIHTLYRKPFAVIPQGLPAAVDAELMEVAHWFDQKAKHDGLMDGDAADPYLSVERAARALNPLKVVTMVANGVKPGNVQSVERHTEERYSKYGGAVSAAEAGAAFVSFAVGAFTVVGIIYIRDEVIGSGGGGGVSGGSLPLPPGTISTLGETVAVFGGVFA